MKDKLNKNKYIMKHRKSFREVEKELLGRNTLAGYLHDLDKIFLNLFMEPKDASKIHRSYSRHHDNIGRAKRKRDYVQMVIDWECARRTKPDKPYNARMTMEIFYPHLRDKVEPILDELGL